MKYVCHIAGVDEQQHNETTNLMVHCEPAHDFFLPEGLQKQHYTDRFEHVVFFFKSIASGQNCTIIPKPELRRFCRHVPYFSPPFGSFGGFPKPRFLAPFPGVDPSQAPPTKFSAPGAAPIKGTADGVDSGGFNLRGQRIPNHLKPPSCQVAQPPAKQIQPRPNQEFHHGRDGWMV